MNFIEALDFFGRGVLKVMGESFQSGGICQKTWRRQKISRGIGEWIKAMGEGKKFVGECFRGVCY